jgi:cellulose biosynthesis protein BcsQ
MESKTPDPNGQRPSAGPTPRRTTVAVASAQDSTLQTEASQPERPMKKRRNVARTPSKLPAWFWSLLVSAILGFVALISPIPVWAKAVVIVSMTSLTWATYAKELSAKDPRSTIPTQGMPALLYRFMNAFGATSITSWVPPMTLKEREQIAAAQIERVRFNDMKVIAIVSLKGGVGKTTLSLLLSGMIKQRRKAFSVLVQDSNPDSGTLGIKIRSTVKFSLPDLIRNLQYVEKVTDFVRYCNETSLGVYVLSSRMSDLFEDTDIDAYEQQKLRPLIDAVFLKASGLFNVQVDDCGTSNKDPINIAALARAHKFVIPTTPAEDSLLMAMKTLRFLLKRHPEKAKQSLIVVNMMGRRNRLEYIRQRFETLIREEEDFHSLETEMLDCMETVTIMPVGYSRKLRNSRDVNPTEVGRKLYTQLIELTARWCNDLADMFSDDPDSQLTHLQELSRLRVAGEQTPTEAESAGGVVLSDTQMQDTETLFTSQTRYGQ